MKEREGCHGLQERGSRLEGFPLLLNIGIQLFACFTVSWHGTIFKIPLEFVTTLYLFYDLAFWPRGM